MNMQMFMQMNIYFGSFGVEHVPKEIKKFIEHLLNIKTNILEYKQTIQ